MPLATWRVPNSEFKSRVRDYLVLVVLCSFIVLILFFKCPSRFWMMMMMMMIPAFAQDDVDFPSCLVTINGESSL